MEADWSIEAGPDDPVIVIPWLDANGDPGYLDLRANLTLVDQVSEAREWPEVRQMLLTLNTPDSAVWTAKCDAWMLDEEEKQLDFGPVAFGFAAYFDIFEKDPPNFLSLARVRARVEAWAQLARPLALPDARVDFVIRPALSNDAPGFATTLYVFGYGAQEAQARENWAIALAAIARLVSQVRAG